MNKDSQSKEHTYKGMIDLYRIVAILLIMKHHLYIEGGRFQSAWIYVEFFFILTGCLAAKKFVEASNDLGGGKLFHILFISSGD